MNAIETRLRRIEAAVQENQQDPGDEAYRTWLLRLAEAVYETDDGPEQQRQIAALGPKPPAVTELARAFERAAELIYGGI